MVCHFDGLRLQRNGRGLLLVEDTGEGFFCCDAGGLSVYKRPLIWFIVRNLEDARGIGTCSATRIRANSHSPAPGTFARKEAGYACCLSGERRR